jgi:hypothetical protein
MDNSRADGDEGRRRRKDNDHEHSHGAGPGIARSMVVGADPPSIFMASVSRGMASVGMVMVSQLASVGRVRLPDR